MSASVLGLPVSFWLPIGIMAVVAFLGDRIKLSAQLRLAILRKGIIRTFLMLPLPAGEGWGGGSKVKIMPVRSIFTKEELIYRSKPAQNGGERQYFGVIFQKETQQMLSEQQINFNLSHSRY
jgi:predicted methyltransferase MtxX (methanogen marker protein 4)